MSDLEDYQNPPGYGETIGAVLNWQPIETAPKGLDDEVLVWTQFGLNVVAWLGGANRQTGYEGWHVYDGYGWHILQGAPPTHWMPLSALGTPSASE